MCQTPSNPHFKHEMSLCSSIVTAQFESRILMKNLTRFILKFRKTQIQILEITTDLIQIQVLKSDSNYIFIP